MKALVVEDNFTCRRVLQRLLEPHGEVHIAVNGEEALEAFRDGMEKGQPYDLVCLDIMMPGLDGLGALEKIREIEKSDTESRPQARVIMTTSLDDSKSILKAFNDQCEAYLVKPVDGHKLQQHLRDFGLIP